MGRDLLGGGSNLARNVPYFFFFFCRCCWPLAQHCDVNVDVGEANGQMDEQIIPQIPRGNYKCPFTLVLGPSLRHCACPTDARVLSIIMSGRRTFGHNCSIILLLIAGHRA